MQTSDQVRPMKTVELMVRPLEPEAFSPFGQVINTSADGKPFGADDAQLEFHGTPRFYILSLKHKEPRFRQITRHLKVTQCLASVGAKPWFLAVAPPNDPDNADAVPEHRGVLGARPCRREAASQRVACGPLLQRAHTGLLQSGAERHQQDGPLLMPARPSVRD